MGEKGRKNARERKKKTKVSKRDGERKEEDILKKENRIENRTERRRKGERKEGRK